MCSGRAACEFLGSKLPFVQLEICTQRSQMTSLTCLNAQPQQLFEASKSWILDRLGLNFDLYLSSVAPPTPAASVSGQMAADAGICGG